jgi:CMP-N,N'-diacetyllegionaminic acid synthase
MAFQNKSIFALIPARGGSKSIPGKNLRTVGAVSLVGRAAQVAKALPWLDYAMLSTDDAEIATEGRKHGLDVPFLRPAQLSTDSATSIEMWRHAWLEAEKHCKRSFDLSILLEPTSPLRRPEDIEETVSTLVSGDFAAAATVSPAPAHFSPHKCLTVSQKGLVGFYRSDGAEYSIRQKIPQYYFRNGVCYAVKRETLVDGGRIIEQDCAAVIIDRPLVNIDEPFELELAEFLLARQSRSHAAG